MTRGLAKVNRVLGKSPMQAKRAAINQQDKALTSIVKGKMALESIARTNPGKLVNEKIIRPSIEAPATAIALKAIPIPGASAAVNVVGRPEKKFWRGIYVPSKRGRITRYESLGNRMHRTSERYMNTKTARNVEGVINGGLQSMKIMLGA